MNIMLALVAALAVVGNPGFEEGKKDLNSFPHNASIDTEVFRSGIRSLKMVVKDYKKDDVYVTRLIPVKPGYIYSASVWMKIADVVSAPVRNGPVGAGLYVEWADANGRWMLGTGAKHVAKHYGTHDWQKLEAKGICVPDKVAYAIVYFVLRAGGTAWFDDFEFKEDFATAVQPVFPADGSRIGTNRPRFAWRTEGFQLANHILKLSSDPTFPADKTVTVTCGSECACRFDRPLDPGTYYWTVMPPALDAPLKAWRFEQPLPADVDVTPPELLTRGARVHGNRETVRFRVREEGSAAAPSARIGDWPAAEVNGRGDGVWELVFKTDKKFWKKGLSELRLEVADAAGNRTEESVYVLNAPASATSVRVASDGRYEENGTRIFPIGIYQVATNYLDEVKAAGFDVVHMYAWESSQDDTAPRGYLDACRKAGLKAFIGFDRGSWNRVVPSFGVCGGNFGHIARRVAALSDHPALFCWYLFDEPNIDYQYVSPSRLTACANLIRALDPDHPVVVSTYGEMMRDYVPSYDTHWSQLYNTCKMNHKELVAQRERIGQSTPVTMLVSSYARTKKLADKDDFPIKEKAFRSRTYLSLVEGANGLFWWWFARDNGLYVTAAECPKAWQQQIKVVGELREMLPIVNAPGAATRGCTPDGSVLWWRKSVGAKTLLVAVNVSGDKVTVSLDLPDGGPTDVTFEPDEAKRWSKE